MDPERHRFFTFDGVIAALLGLIALGFGVVLILRPLQQGLLIAPIGAGAAAFGVRALKGRRSRTLPLVGLATGLLGAVLIVAGLLRSALGF